MKFSTPTTSTLLLALAMGLGNIPTALATLTCLTPDAPADLRETSQLLALGEKNLSPRQLPGGNTTIEIPVYFHVITSGFTLDAGWVPGESIVDQVSLMNTGFKRANIKFVLKAVDYVVNAEWANSNGDPGLEERQKLLRKGDYRTLNIVLIPGMGNGGRCTYPSKFSDRNLLFDRCEVGTGALPRVKGRVGRTTIHEVGHWLGLMHTFEGGCDGVGDTKGDLVADTPPHKHDFFGIADCPVGLNTCPDQPGNDPTTNYMSYFSEKCMSEETGFTDGQIRRMHGVWGSLRRDSPRVEEGPLKITPLGGGGNATAPVPVVTKTVTAPATAKPTFQVMKTAKSPGLRFRRGYEGMK